MRIKISLFSAQKDEPFLKDLKAHLRSLQTQGLIDIEEIQDTQAGLDWEQDLYKSPNQAQIILLLISPYFLASDYCYEVQMKRVMELQARGEARVIPIILSHCDWKQTPVSKLQALPKNAKPITEWEDREAAFHNIIVNIRRVVEELTNPRGGTMVSYYPNSLDVFLSYSHADESMVTEIETHLKMLVRKGLITLWHDGMISPGKDWSQEIHMHLQRAKIFLLLISQNHLHSDFLYQIELPFAMNQHNRGEARVIPIILSPCDWKDAPFSKLQVLPKNAKPITEWTDREGVLNSIVVNIRRVVEEVSLEQHTNKLITAKALLTIDSTSTVPQTDKEEELERIEQALQAAFEKRVSLAIAQKKEQISSDTKDMEKVLAEMQMKESAVTQQKDQAVQARQNAEEKAKQDKEQIRELNRRTDIYAAIAAIMLGFTLIAAFEFCIRWFQWNWLLSHQNSYGLQVGFDILLMIVSISLFGAIRISQRKRRLNGEELAFLGAILALAAIVIGILVGMFQLMGGPPVPGK